MELENDFDAFEDDLEVVELMETVLNLLIQIEGLEFPTDKNDALSPINQLLTTLRFYSTGGHFSLIADYMGIHTSTASRIIQRVSRVIASKYNEYVKMPENDLGTREAQNNFYNIARFPRIIGALDCAHVKIESPGGESQKFLEIVLHNIARRMGEVDPPLPEEINNNELQILIEEGQIPGVAKGLGANENIAGQLRRNFINNFFGQL
ncbi:hypothetical protein Zmor_000866 [Zophobas morio]|uniref:Nuclease HARBI1 n=1 Tax=Zophobas morio TaxID=2755281 RepID=A0AA38J795_9CUCU|nr:hypothetical protein Zmor_000866 [Zophobas morio]